MAVTNRKRRVFPVRTVRALMGPAVRRIVTLGGVAAAGWLLAGAAPAMADGLQVESPAEVSSLVQPGPQDPAGQDDGGEAAPAPEPQQPAAPEPQPQPAPAPESSEPAATQGGGSTEGSAVGRTLDTVTDTDRAASSLSAVTTGTGEAARSTVTSTAEGAGEVLSSTARTADVRGRAEKTLGESALTEKVADELASSKDALGTDFGRGLGRGKAGTVVEGITGSTRGGGSSGDGDEHRDRADRTAKDDTHGSRSAAKRNTHTAALDRTAKQDLYAQFADAQAADEGADHDGGPGDDDAGAADPGGHPWPKGAESTGAVSSPVVPSMAAAAGFLTHRADARKPLALGAVLPGDPTLVVRDAADDPSFSPD